MLSERGLAVIEKLIENNHRPITAKALAASLGVSERSVKTYIKEVSDFCGKKGIKLNRTPGVGFEADFTEEQIKDVEALLLNKVVVLSQQQRVNYISYILLSGWDTYTVSLFSEELSVSKNVINDDIKFLEPELEHFGISISKTLGHGVSASGGEFEIRKALHHMCKYPIGNKHIDKIYDHRIAVEESNLWLNNFSQANYENAVAIVHYIEEKYGILYTDYSTQMLVEYLTIQMFRLRVGKCIEGSIGADSECFMEHIVGDIASQIEDKMKLKLTSGEVEYIRVLVESANMQNGNYENMNQYATDAFCCEIIEYLSEMLSVNLMENELLRTSIESFSPASLQRTRYGIEVKNPFLQDITEMYSGIFATCFTLSRFYEKYAGKMPSDHEIAFIALLVGGALHRAPQSIRAILIGTGGIAAANIVAAKIENKISDINVVAILSSEKINSLDDYEYDIVLSMLPGQNDSDKVVHISPIVSSRDEKLIRDKCLELRTDYGVEKSEFAKLIDYEHILFSNKNLSKKEIIKLACQKLIEDGYVSKEFMKDVLDREKVEATAIGNEIAIPHGKTEHVITPKICVVRTGEPVDWGNIRVNTIFLLALNFENMITTKAFFRDFTRVLSEQDSLQAIKSATDSKELEGVLKAKLHWI